MHIKPPLDRYLMMIGLALLLSLTNLEGLEGSFWKVFFITLLFTFAYWEGNFQIVDYIFEKYPRIEQTTHRILAQISGSLLYTIVVGSLIVWMLHLSSLVPYQAGFHLTKIFIGVFITAIITLIYETVLYFQLWKAALLEKERLKNTEAQLQFESLKNQVNPHFLFNSLNTLSSLIHVDQDKAEQFVQEFAGIYRYVLEVKYKTFVPLKDEIKFVQSYVFLQKIRFDDQLIFENKIHEEEDKLFIPPLILQNLVENCIKHNVISEKHPLCVELSVQGSVLTVKNKLKERENPIESTKTGLYNIQERLKLTNDKEARFYKKDGYFYAEVPLIEPE